MNCNVIRDLLPLYAEDMVSPESKALVEDHLQGCESCTKELEDLKNTPKLPWRWRRAASGGLETPFRSGGR